MEILEPQTEPATLGPLFHGKCVPQNAWWSSHPAAYTDPTCLPDVLIPHLHEFLEGVQLQKLAFGDQLLWVTLLQKDERQEKSRDELCHGSLLEHMKSEGSKRTHKQVQNRNLLSQHQQRMLLTHQHLGKIVSRVAGGNSKLEHQKTFFVEIWELEKQTSSPEKFSSRTAPPGSIKLHSYTMSNVISESRLRHQTSWKCTIN